MLLGVGELVSTLRKYIELIVENANALHGTNVSKELANEFIERSLIVCYLYLRDSIFYVGKPPPERL
jgi:hypothetical protein